MSDLSGIPIVHTWRNCSFFYNGVYDYDESAVGAVVAAEKHNLSRVVEIRHLKGHMPNRVGHLFIWSKVEGRWDEKYIGEGCEGVEGIMRVRSRVDL